MIEVIGAVVALDVHLAGAGQVCQRGAGVVRFARVDACVAARFAVGAAVGGVGGVGVAGGV